MRFRAVAAVAAVVLLTACSSGDPLDEFRESAQVVQAAWDELDCTSMKAATSDDGCDGVMLGMASAAATITQAADKGAAIPEDVYEHADAVVARWVEYGDAEPVDTGAISFDLVRAWDKMVGALG